MSPLGRTGKQPPWARRMLSAKLRRAVRTRGHFPNDDGALKLLFLVLNLAEREWEDAAQGMGHGQGPVRDPVRGALPGSPEAPDVHWSSLK